MAKQKQAVREVRIVWECEPTSFSLTDIHIMNTIEVALSKVRGTHIAVAFFDEEGHRLRRNELSGEMSPEMEKLWDYESTPSAEGVAG